MSRSEIEPEVVLKVAQLAKLKLSPQEVEMFTSQLGQIVDYVDQLTSVDTEGVEPLDHVMEVTNALREDQLRPSLERSHALANAPKQDGETFLVPPVLG